MKNKHKKNKIAQKRASKTKDRQQKYQQELKTQLFAESLNSIPKITSGTFDVERNSVENFQNRLKKALENPSLNTSTYKKRVLFVSEASYLHTGFSTYAREVLKRLHASGLVEVAEFGSYGDSPLIDPSAKKIPWKYYHNNPTTMNEANIYGLVNGQQIHEGYRENQFGKWKFPYVLIDFKPDIVISIRDHWMDAYIKQSPLRKNFIWIWMPTVDGYPQKWDWLNDYSTVDYLVTYSWFGKSVLEEQSRTLLAKQYKIPSLNVKEVCQPGADTNIFKPIPREEILKFFNMDPNTVPTFIGTVMRNQPRKLFTRIIESFRIFKEKYPLESHNVKLLLHTSIPDVGWDISECVLQNGLYEHVLYTYICDHCNSVGISNFLGMGSNGNVPCPICRQQTFHTPNTRSGFSDQQLAYVYNLLDIYIQGSIGEGEGMPINEAKCCGTPVLCSDYSAMAEKARNGGALPIKNDTIYTEHETMQWRSLFDRDDLATKLALILGTQGKRQQLSTEAYKCGVQYYNWDLCALKWLTLIAEIPIKNRITTWEGEYKIKNITSESAPNLEDDKEWLTWCYKNIVSGKEPDPEGLRYWLNILKSSKDKKDTRNKIENFFREKVRQDNSIAQLINNPETIIIDPIERVRNIINEHEKEISDCKIL